MKLKSVTKTCSGINSDNRSTSVLTNAQRSGLYSIYFTGNLGSYTIDGFVYVSSDNSMKIYGQNQVMQYVEYILNTNEISTRDSSITFTGTATFYYWG